MEYIIVGDTKQYDSCLIYVCGKSKEGAEKAVRRMLTNPDKHDIQAMKGHTNIRVKEVEDKTCWWNDYLD